MEKTTVIPPPLQGVDTYFVASDWHSYHINPACFSILIQHAKLHKPDNRRLIINGDFLDFEFFMNKFDSYKKNMSRMDGIEDYFMPLYDEEIAWGNTCLDILQKVFNEVIFISGNHDKPRVSSFLSDCPSGYHHHFNFEKSLKLKDRNITFVEYNDWLDVGEVSITHGMFHGTSAMKKHYMASGARSVIFGHVHHDNKESFMVRGKTRQVYSLPAMCNLNPKYIKNQETNWTNGYSILNVKTNGHFNYHSFTVWDNELVLPSGKILKYELSDEVKALSKHC